MNRATRSYLRAVKRAIPLRDMRNRVMETLTKACEDFEKEVPDADRTDYYSRFGHPKDVARTALENVDTDVVQRELTKSRRIWRIAILSAAIVLLCIVVLFIAMFIDAHESANGYFQDDGPYEVTMP